MKYYLTFDYAMVPALLEGAYPDKHTLQSDAPAYFVRNAYNGIPAPFIHPQRTIAQETKKLIAAWKHFIRTVICDNNIDAYNYLCGWVGHLLQYPGKKNNVALCLRGESGSGKTVFFDLLTAMLGAHYTCQTNTTRGLARNPALVRSLLVNFDNVQFTSELDAWLKARLEKLDQLWNGREIKVYTRYLLSTNDMRAFNGCLAQPRYFICDVSWQMKDKDAYFSNLVGSREHKERLKLAAPYLSAFFGAVNLKKWDMTTRSQAKLVQPDLRRPNHFKQYLYDILKGDVHNIYFWKSDGFVFTKQISWELYKGDTTPGIFYQLLVRAGKRLENPSDWIYGRFTDIARDYSVRFYPERLTLTSLRNNLQSVFGSNVLQTKVLSHGVVAEWFCINQEMALAWIN
jgi:hypothetical protein